MKNAVYGKTMNVTLISNKKDYLKWSSKPAYISQNIFDNDLVAIRKSKVTLKLINHDLLGCVY